MNDAPVSATADIDVAMGNNLWKLPEAISLANVLFGGVTMALGMLFHQASVLIVIANAMRLLRRRHVPVASREDGVLVE